MRLPNARAVSSAPGVSSSVPASAGVAAISPAAISPATITLARASAGLVQTHRFLLEDLARGTLVEVLQRFGGRSRPFSVLYAATRHMPLRVRLFIDFLVEQSQRVQARHH